MTVSSPHFNRPHQEAPGPSRGRQAYPSILGPPTHGAESVDAGCKLRSYENSLSFCCERVESCAWKSPSWPAATISPVAGLVSGR
ncbi:hypothetical protein VTN02DRAFT_969 [Thermoascus thermophilus]